MIKRQDGFTIIEVLIVLTIFSIIALIVFLVVPTVQRNARNVQRRNDVARIVEAIHEQMRLNRNQPPNSCNNTQNWCFLRNVELTFYDNKSTSINNVSFYKRPTPYDAATDPPLNPNDVDSASRVSIRSFAKCDGGTLTGVNATARNLAAQFVIETSHDILQCYQY